MKTSLLIASLLVFTGCAPWQYYDANDPAARYNSKPANYVIPILNRAEVSHTFREIGQVSALGGTYATQRDMYKAIRAKARAIGADALIDAHYSDNRLYPDLTATAIVYTKSTLPKQP